jgi:DNA-binding transcriptional LysR family regulator
MLRMVAAGEGVTTWPAEEGVMISEALPGVFAVPLNDTPHAVFSIVGHEDRFSTAVEWLVDAGRELAAEVGDLQLSE